MNNGAASQRYLSPEGVRDELQRQPHILMRLAENSLTVAESLRDNYFVNTANFVSALRRSIAHGVSGKRADPPLFVNDVPPISWSDLQGEVVTFIDGGVGQVQLGSQVPVLLRVGSYSVRTGARQLSEREQFGYYPVVLGDIEGGSKERRDFIDIVRITSELLGGLSALERTSDLRMLMFHGPLVYVVWRYAGHAPFTERDIDLFLRQYAPDSDIAASLKADFLREAELDIYPAMMMHPDEWIKRRLFDPLAWMAFLYRRLINEALQRSPVPIVAGVVERGTSREFVEKVMLSRVFRSLRERSHIDYFNEMYGRSDLSSPKALLDRLGYTDRLLLAMVLRPGQYTESWPIAKYSGFREARESVAIPLEPSTTEVSWASLAPPSIFGFPSVMACYIHVSERTEPIRVEVFRTLGDDQIDEAVSRAYLYARLLPGYGFPVGLDIADKYAHVPAWLTEAYGKLIRHHLGVSLQQGEISDAQMRDVLVHAIYMTHRDWLLRPTP